MTRASAFVLQHARSDDSGQEDVKLIGVYSSRARAEAAMPAIEPDA